ncbi:MAG: bifunctional DNA-formamidopyrimidine glycosylase/DNA-(apurinic or apyrimidinic site) lyase [bacterium]|nr:bifunctional DNA-formamidopyrimidine glycosylase/DNA-(apurinic or apyrimidinic site) lyase [bacterium]
MPELPEVTTIVRELNSLVRGKVIKDIETDTPKLVRPLTVAQFRAAVRGKAFLGFRRRAKFILAALGASSRRRVPSRQSPVSSYLIWHMGMTGHPLYRNPQAEIRNPKVAAAMRDPMNQHVRVTFHFTDGTWLEYADIRKFGKLELVRASDLSEHSQLRKLGPDAVELARRPKEFCEKLSAQRRSLKVVLMDQHVVAGIGNIYADEILWTARLHPLLKSDRVHREQCTVLTRAVRTVLERAIRARGASIDDFRRVRGEKGRYQEIRKAYQRTGLPCSRCGTLIQRLVVGGRGTHICPRCQRISPTKNSV